MARCESIGCSIEELEHEREGDVKIDGNRFHSFAPKRDDSQAMWYVDGEEYMWAVAEAINAAQKEIFITDWMLSPYIALKREGEELHVILKRKACVDKVCVHILLYEEVEKALELGSKVAQSVFEDKKDEQYEEYKNYIHIHRHGGKLEDLYMYSHHEKVVVIDRSIAFVGGIDLCYGRWDTHAHKLTDTEIPYSWHGLDYCNTFRTDPTTKVVWKSWKVSLIDRLGTPRLPWHDVSCAFTGPAAEDVAHHFIDRYKHNLKFRKHYPLSHEKPFPPIDHSIPIPPMARARAPCNVSIQVLRSAAEWSVGKREKSIQEAYIEMINESNDFVYIENQFFISSQSKRSLLGVQNKIQSALCDKILTKYKAEEKFHAFIVLPLQPEFPGKWGDESGRNLEIVSYWTYVTLFSEKDSLMTKLENGGVPRDKIPDYISVYGLRTHDELNGKLITEMIYVHSKVMIVDDQKAIIGSANINDRSMEGDRDSEVDVIIEDNEFSKSLRCCLFKEHFGDDMDVTDPTSENFRTGLLSRAVENTEIYNRVFTVLPSDAIRSFEDLKNTPECLAVPFTIADSKELDKIHGRVVTFPQYFMKDRLKELEPSLLLRPIDWVYHVVSRYKPPNFDSLNIVMDN